MSTHPTTLRHRIRRGAAIAAGVATLGGLALASMPATASANVPAAAAPNATIMVVHNKTWGSLLALSNGDTLYRFVHDSKNHSACNGKCAKIWPPVDLAKNQKAPIGKGVKGLGTINRGGGVKQVTYEGIPLYRFVGDTAAFQVKGNIKDSFGQWYSVNPANPTAIPHAAKAAGSAKPPTTSASSGSGGAAF